MQITYKEQGWSSRYQAVHAGIGELEERMQRADPTGERGQGKSYEMAQAWDKEGGGDAKAAGQW